MLVDFSYGYSVLWRHEGDGGMKTSTWIALGGLVLFAILSSVMLDRL
jgi:hypothetical protein